MNHEDDLIILLYHSLTYHLLEEMMYLTDDEETDNEETDGEDDDENDNVDSWDETGKVVNELSINPCDIVLFIHFVSVD